MKLIPMLMIAAAAFNSYPNAAAAKNKLLLKEKNYSVILNSSNNRISAYNGKNKLFELGEVWDIKTADGKTIAPNTAKLNKLSVDSQMNEALLEYSNKDINVKLKLSLKNNKLTITPELFSKKLTVEYFGLPAGMIFPVKSQESVMVAGMQGVELQSSFFRKISIGKSPFAKWSKIGGAPLKMFNPDVQIGFDKITEQSFSQTSLGEKWLGQKVTIKDKVKAPRPSVDKNHIPLFKTQKGSLVAVYTMGKGLFIRFASCPQSYAKAMKIYHPILRSVLKKLMQENKDSVLKVLQLCKSPGHLGLDYCRNNIFYDLKGIKNQVNKEFEIKLLRTWPELKNNLTDQTNRNAVVVNSFYEGLPVKNPAEWQNSVNIIKSFVKSGGIWIEFAGGYPFFKACSPKDWNSSFIFTYPDGGNGFSDFLFKKSTDNSFAVYGVQPSTNPVLDKNLDPDKYYLAAKYYIYPDQKGNAVLSRKWYGSTVPGKKFNYPELVIKLGGSLKDDYQAYSDDNEIKRLLKEKVKPELFKKLSRSLFLKINDRHSKIQKWIDLVNKTKLPGPVLYHHMEWAHVNGHFDQYYPDFFPYDPKFGNKNDLKRFYDTVHFQGSLVMPYTQPLFWDATLSRMDNRPLIKAAMKADGKTCFTPEAMRNYILSLTIRRANRSPWGWRTALVHVDPWLPIVRETNMKVFNTFVNELGCDLFFHDSIGAESYKINYNAVPNLRHANLYGILAMVEQQRKTGKAPLVTEGGGDRFMNIYTMLCGANQYMITSGNWGVRSLYSDRFGEESLRLFPFTMYMQGDKVMRIGHNLGYSIISRQMLTWCLTMGFTMQYSTDLRKMQNDLKSSASWIRVLSAVQNCIGPLIVGQKVKKIEYIVDKVLKINYDNDIEVIGNLRPKIFKSRNNTVIAKWGFLVRNSQKNIAGIIRKDKKDMWFVTNDNGKIVNLKVSAKNDFWEPALCR